MKPGFANDETVGPIQFVHLQQLAMNGEITGKTSVGQSGAGWAPASSVPELNRLIVQLEENQRLAKSEAKRQKQEAVEAKRSAKEGEKEQLRQARESQRQESQKIQAPTPPAQMASKMGNNDDSEKTLFTGHPSVWRTRPVLFAVAILLCFVGIGFLIIGYWFIDSYCTTLTISNRRTSLRRGILSKSINEVRHKDVRNVQLKQSLFQRIFGVGYIGISSAGQGGVEIEVNGMADPNQLKTLVDQYRD